LSDVRLEFVEETTVGNAPSDPSWSRFSDYIADAPGWDGGPDISENNALGSGDTVDITRGSEEHTFTLQYWLQRAPVDGNGDPTDPIAVPLTHDFNAELTSHTVVFRRETTSGGNDGAGFRMFTVGLGCKPISSTIPGDPGESAPQSLELEYQAEYGRTVVIHQPSSSTTLDITNNGTNSVDVTIENEGASTAETNTVAGGATVTTTATFGDIDSVWIDSGEPDGDVVVTDGAGTTFTTLTGTSTTDPDYEQGVPPLGSGSHGSAISTDPERFLGLNTDIRQGGTSLADRVHGWDLSVELESSQDAIIGSRFAPVDEGVRTASVDVDVAGPYESTKQLRDFFSGAESDIVLSVGGTSSADGVADITLTNAQLTDADEQSYGAGDSNVIYGTTFTAQNSTASSVSVTNTT